MAAFGKAFNDKTKLQTVQLEILDDEIEDGIEHFRGYGVSFYPPKESEALVLNLGGDRETMVAILAELR